MQHDSQVAPQVFLAKVADIRTVDEDLTLLDVVKAAEKIDNSGLPRSGRPDQRDRLSGLRAQGHVLDHGYAGLVAEVNILELNVAFDLRDRDC